MKKIQFLKETNRNSLTKRIQHPLFFIMLFFISSTTYSQIQFSISYGEIVEKKNNTETLSNTWEFATIDMTIDNTNSKFKVSRYEKLRDTFLLKSTFNLEQIEKWNYDSERGINWCLVKKLSDYKYYIACYYHSLTNESQFILLEYDQIQQKIGSNSIYFQNVTSSEKHMLTFLSGDGTSVYRYDVDHSNSFDLYNSIRLARISATDNVRLSYTSNQVLLEDEANFLKIIFPPDYQHSYLIHRNISRNITFKDGVYTFRNDSIPTSGGFGIGNGKNGFDKFTYSWFFPDNIEIISYKCNRTGKWQKDETAITFNGDKGINNILFEISYKIHNVTPREVEKTKITLKETILIPNKKTKVSIWDDKQEDGDIISLSLNGEWIIRNLEVKKCQTSFYLDLDQGENFLVMKAENTGSIPPNTAAFLFTSDGFSKKITLSSDLGKSEMIKLNVE